MTDTLLFSLARVQLAYRAMPALRDITWHARHGQQWACVGPNGSGKTSLARILSGQAPRYSGQLQLGSALQEQGVAYVCFEQARALVERDRKLDDSETRADATDPGTLVRQLVLGPSPPNALFRHWVARLGIEPILDRGLRYISTGEMRKSLLISAILRKPGLLILDSPLDGLDQATQDEFRQVLDELLRSDQAVLMLCRQAEDLPPGVTHVIVLDAGQSIAVGERAAVLEAPAVQQLLNPTPPTLGPVPSAAPREYQVPAELPLLQLRNVSVAYGNLQVLRNVNWTFSQGQHCAVAGPNGCGKSTLLSLVTGDNHKAYGQDITLFGRRRGSGESIWEIKQKFGQLDNQLHLNFARGMKVIEVVVSGFFDTIGLYDDWGDDQRRIAGQWLAALGLSDYSRQSFDGLSFGLQRMVLLARAMVKSPLILLLDEPTLGVDAPHRRLLLAAIDHIAMHSDTQVIFVSHSAGEAPACINQRLLFEPHEAGFVLRCED
jgi:molybdate transport system ATP-binding protein